MIIEAARKQLDKALTELSSIQQKYHGEKMPTEVGDRFDTLATEAKDLQDTIDTEMERQERFEALDKWRGKVADPTLPADEIEDVETKSRGRIAGYVTLGDYVTAQKSFQDYMEAGAPKNGSPAAVLPAVSLFKMIRLPDGTPLVPLVPDQRKAIEDLWETKAAPTLTNVIEPQRLPGVTQTTADDELRIRDVIATGQTQSDNVTFIRRSAQTRAAAPTAHGTAKPEAAVTFTEVTAPVRTIAAWMPVHTQQLADWAQLRSEIDSFLLYDVDRKLEDQIIYGSGAGQNLEGLEVVTGTTDISGLGRYVATTHTLIDAIRMGITEVKTAGWRANAVLLHPQDWETIILLKATDNNYIWVVVTDENGARLWGLRVVETEAMQEQAGNPTEQRNLIVGDFLRGAQLIDRMQSQVLVGLNADDFTKNQRTILAELRAALAIRAPAAFAKLETQALAT